MPQYVNIQAGDPAPWFRARTAANPRYVFETAGGQYLVLCFFGTAADAHSQAAIEAVQARPDLFDDRRAAWFGVSADPADEASRRIEDNIPGYRVFWDFDGAVSRLYGAAPTDAAPGQRDVPLRRLWAVLDPTLRLIAVIPFAADRSDIAQVLEVLDGLPPPALFAGFEVQAPVLVLPRVFDADLCRRLILAYDTGAPAESGFMQEIGGKTVKVHNHAQKRRRDVDLQDDALIAEARRCIRRRIVPEIMKVHQFAATRIERHVVACYAAEDSAHFRAHRDNTTPGTAHRRFAVSVLLNDAYEGGDLYFPEYGPRGFKPAPGAAIVFSCSLLHAVRTVTAGRRYAFLPFLYDDAAAKVREMNNPLLGEGVAPYRASQEKPAAAEDFGAGLEALPRPGKLI